MKPRFKVTMKQKGQDGKKFAILAGWADKKPGSFYMKAENAYGDRPGAVGVLLSDGTTLRFDECFIDMWDGEPERDVF